MKISKQNVGGLFVIKNTHKNNSCMDCSNCIGLKILEMGLIPGSKVLFDKYNLGMWVLKIINESGFAESTIALREEEAKKLITEDGCLISFESIN